jgi:hypothetical protein
MNQIIFFVNKWPSFCCWRWIDRAWSNTSLANSFTSSSLEMNYQCGAVVSKFLDFAMYDTQKLPWRIDKHGYDRSTQSSALAGSIGSLVSAVKPNSKYRPRSTPHVPQIKNVKNATPSGMLCPQSRTSSCEATRRCNPERFRLHTHLRQNLNSHWE